MGIMVVDVVVVNSASVKSIKASVDNWLSLLRMIRLMCGGAAGGNIGGGGGGISSMLKGSVDSIIVESVLSKSDDDSSVDK